MTDILCAAADCRSSSHARTCADDTCRGCIPRQATDGLRLCGWHAARLAEWPMEAAELYADLALMLTQSGGGGEKVNGSPNRGLTVNEAAVEQRSIMRHRFVGWCRLIHEERGWRLPSRREPEQLPYGFIGPPRLAWVTDDSVPAMARYIARSAKWLAAHSAAADAAEELRDMARGEARRVAYPSGARKFQVKTPVGELVPCLQHVTDDEDGLTPCPGHLWTILRREDSLLPSELRCSHDETHVIPAWQWIRMGKRLMRHAGTGEEVA